MLTRKWMLLLSLSVATAGLAPRSLSPAIAGDCDDILAARTFDDVRLKTNNKQAHDAITADLYNGEILSVKPFSENDNKQSIFIVRVRAKDPYTGQERMRDAIFKPRRYGDGDGWGRSPMEYVAYFLNRALGMDYVPPTAYRKGLNIKVNGETLTEGALIFFTPKYEPLAKLPGEVFRHIDDAVISDSRILNVILQNKDAHNKNFGEGEHWVDGSRRPVFLDFGASLRAGTNVSLTDFPVFGNSKPVTKIRQSTLDALNKMSSETFRPLVESGMISKDEAMRMDATRVGILSYFNNARQDAIGAGKPVASIVLPF